MRKFTVDIPEEIWEHIILMLGQDRYIQPLSLVSRQLLSITGRHKRTLKISDPTALSLPSLFRRFPNLKHLSLSDFTGDPFPILLQVATFDFELETLDLSNHKSLPVEGLEQLPVSTLNSIKSLLLGSLTVIGDYDLKMIGNLFPNLENLDLSHSGGGGGIGAYDDGNRMITDHGLALLVSKLKALRRINLKGNYRITDEGIISLSMNCSQLEEIAVQDCSSVTQIGIRFALQRCENIRSIGLHGMNLVVDEIRQPLSCARSLSEIDFSYMDVHNDLLIAIVKAELPLKSFTLLRCKGFTYDGIDSFLESYNSLDYMSLEGVCSLSDLHISTLAKSLTKARTVKLNYCGKLSGFTFFTLIKLGPHLETIEMEHTSIGEESCGVSISSRTRTLNLSGNKHLSNDALEKIAVSCPNLEMLDLSSCPGISRRGIGYVLRNCSLLRHLQIEGCSRVNNLDLGANSHHELEVLEASGSGLNDDAMIDVAKKCPRMMTLNLMNCRRLSSKGVKAVVNNCTNLKEINLGYCRKMDPDILPWMVFSGRSLRKIVLPQGQTPTEEEKELYLRHGCYVIMV